MVNLQFIFNVLIFLFSAIWVIGIIISRKKAIKSIEKEKGQILYRSVSSKWEKVYYVVMFIGLIFMGVDFIIEETSSNTINLFLIHMINLGNFTRLGVKRIITAKGIGFQGISNNLTKFISWDAIKDIHWNKFESNKLCITYLYVDSIVDLELKFKKDEVEKINSILESCGCFK